MAKEFIVSKGGRYKENDGDRVASVFFVENTRNEVRYSFEGIGSGREYTTDLETFQKEFTPITPEKQSEKSSGPAKKEVVTGSGINDTFAGAKNPR